MNLNFKDKATSIDELYQNESFVNLSADERVKKLEDHLLSLSIKEIKDYKKEEFVSSIDQILKGEFDLKTMGENGYNYITKNSTYTVMTNQIIKELQQFED